MLVANFMRFRRRLDVWKNTHIDNFSSKKKSKMNSNAKVRSEKILLFFRKETFSNLIFTFIAEKKKIEKKINNVFFRTLTLPNKKKRNKQNFE